MAQGAATQAIAYSCARAIGVVDIEINTRYLTAVEQGPVPLVFPTAIGEIVPEQDGWGCEPPLTIFPDGR